MRINYDDVKRAIITLHLDEYYPLIEKNLCEFVDRIIYQCSSYNDPFKKFIKMVQRSGYHNGLSFDERCDKINSYKKMRKFNIFNKYKMNDFIFPTFVSEFCKAPLPEIINAFYMLNMKYRTSQINTKMFNNNEIKKIYKISDIYLVYKLANFFSEFAIMHEIDPNGSADFTYFTSYYSASMYWIRYALCHNKTIAELLEIESGSTICNYCNGYLPNKDFLDEEIYRSHAEKIYEMKKNALHILINTDIDILKNTKNNNPEIDIAFGEVIDLLCKKPRNIKRCKKILEEINLLDAYSLLIELIRLPGHIESLNIPTIVADIEQNIFVEI